MSSSDADAPRELKPVVGTSFARFLNQYSPEHDKPYTRADPNQGKYQDPELAKLLEEERTSRLNKAHNKKKDWMKSYMDECVRFQSITKGGSTKQ
eukprot:CAMPEP_0174850454 /NCGR_PEP_ID=MMETSP1114-20130205/19440_1 /TAXON_ID=312471 /ORGANISM="Neobodo designis, Strain CCAP 1951/1" /LENGTH=94 /DNA_ID=CAMNT_0016084915 /DNA_START=43 /DNA_END=327 /DNA_ORIENTATION=+